MADEEFTVEEQIDNMDAAVTAIVDLLVEKGFFTQEEFDKKINSYYEK